MNRLFKRILPLVGALVFLMVGAALAVPSITVNLQKLGSGSHSFPNSLNVSANVNFILSKDGMSVTGVKVYFTGSDVEKGATVYVNLLDASGNILGSGSGSITQDYSNNFYVEISFSSAVPIDQLDSVKVIYKGQEITS